MQPDIAWNELDTKGYLVIRSFLSRAEIDHIAADYRGANAETNRNYFVALPTTSTLKLLAPKTLAIADAVRGATTIDVDYYIGSAFFPTRLPDGGSSPFQTPQTPTQAIPWHQDLEEWYCFQQHRNCLKFWMPIVKADPARSNLTIAPLDRLNQASPRAYDVLMTHEPHRVTRLANGKTRVMVDSDDPDHTADFELDVDLEDVAVTPPLDAGDLLLWRGDLMHRTQDVETERVALKIDLMSSAGVVSRARLRAGGILKYCFMLKNIEVYQAVLDRFADNRNADLTIRELSDHLNSTVWAAARGEARPPRVSVPEFLAALTDPS